MTKSISVAGFLTVSPFLTFFKTENQKMRFTSVLPYRHRLYGFLNMSKGDEFFFASPGDKKTGDVIYAHF